MVECPETQIWCMDSNPAPLPSLVALLHSQDDFLSMSLVAVQDLKLFLPSTLGCKWTCPIHFLRYEWDFRYAQAQETLNNLCGLLCFSPICWTPRVDMSMDRSSLLKVSSCWLMGTKRWWWQQPNTDGSVLHSIIFPLQFWSPTGRMSSVH